jgi:peroxiredoxin
VQEELGAFEERGASVLAIGQGTGEQAADYADKWGIGFPILGDPKAAAYQGFGMLRGNWWTVLGRSLVTDPLETIRLTFQADMKGAALPAADVLRLPGLAIVAPGGTTRFLYKSQAPSDLPTNAEVLAALDTLA